MAEVKALEITERPAVADGNWRAAALALPAVRFVQGWIYWGGGSRRFIYGPQKLDPHGHWMAYKFQTALPGAILGSGRLIAFLLHHFVLLYAAVIFFSAVELVAGAMLIAGLLTRAAAVATIGLSVVLMLMFGWQGATCIDEWTMAASNLGMGVTLALAGGGAYALDNVLLRQRPGLAGSVWFRWLGGSLPLPLAERTFRNLALALLAFTVVFVVATYSYYRGSVISAFHSGPVSPSRHHISLGRGKLSSDGTVSFDAYIDAGTAAAPANIIAAELTRNGTVIERWDGKALAALPKSAFHNDFPYQQFKAGFAGITAGVGAMAQITLPPAGNALHLSGQGYRLTVITVNGHRFTLALGRVEKP
jgi:thiosulfate dehydrogenase [quinone] large subunit